MTAARPAQSRPWEEYLDLLFRQVYLWFYMELHPGNLWGICCWQDWYQAFFLG